MNKKMKKKILIGSILAVLLMLSMPMISNIQAQPVAEKEKTENNNEFSYFIGILRKCKDLPIGNSMEGFGVIGIAFYKKPYQALPRLKMVGGNWWLIKLSEVAGTSGPVRFIMISNPNECVIGCSGC